MNTPEIAVLMAAGLGKRLRPITDNIPKPLVRVHDQPMIETVIEALEKRGIDTIYIVTGYLQEQFEYLREKYKGIILIHNSDYETVNNISSIRTVSNILIESDADVFICEADLYVRDAGIFLEDMHHSCYFGKMVRGYSDDWVFDTNDEGRIIRVGKKGNNCFNMVGVAWFNKNDAAMLGEIIINAYGEPGYEELFWDDVVNNNLDRLDLRVHPIHGETIAEIDTIEELKSIDTGYGVMFK